MGLIVKQKAWAQQGQVNLLENVTKKMTLAKKGANKKNPQSQSNQPKNQATLPTHGLVILTKFSSDFSAFYKPYCVIGHDTKVFVS